MPVYRIIISLIAPFVLAVLLLRVMMRREGPADFRQRLGGGAGSDGAIWLHGASNGELTSARALIEALRTEFPLCLLVVTANTTSGRDLVAGWQVPRVHARLAPLDLRWVLARFRRAIEPCAEIILENELWPNRIMSSQAPVVCIGARMSARSFRRWRLMGGPGRTVLSRLDWISAQDAASADRLKALGVKDDRLGPVISLKPGVTLPKPPADELAQLQKVFDRDHTILAASTHDGEDPVVLAAFTAARATNPRLKLILAPRHPRRSADLVRLLVQSGMRFAVRSQGQAAVKETEVYLADTLGEMPLWYALAGGTFVGGSLVDKGGHTPFEPVQAGSVVMHGPYVANFQAPYAALDAAGAAFCVSGEGEFADALIRICAPETQNRMTLAARDALATASDDQSDLQPIMAALHCLLD